MWQCLVKYFICAFANTDFSSMQIHERARQGRLRAKFMREIRYSFLREDIVYQRSISLYSLNGFFANLMGIINL